MWHKISNSARLSCENRGAGRFTLFGAGQIYFGVFLRSKRPPPVVNIVVSVILLYNTDINGINLWESFLAWKTLFRGLPALVKPVVTIFCAPAVILLSNSASSMYESIVCIFLRLQIRRSGPVGFGRRRKHFISPFHSLDLGSWLLLAPLSIVFQRKSCFCIQFWLSCAFERRLKAEVWIFGLNFILTTF